MFLYVKYLFNKDTIAHKEGCGRKTKVTNEICQIVEQQMRLDETTASQLYVLLTGMGHRLSL